MRSRKTEKGKYGYIRDQKYRRTLKTICLFIIPIAIFLVGYLLNHGNRNNIYTIIAIVGTIPAAMSAVSMIMMYLRKPISEELYNEIKAAAGQSTMLYELYLTTEKNSMFLDAVLLYGTSVVAYCDREMQPDRINKMQAHIKNSMKIEGIEAGVKIFDIHSKKNFFDRLESGKRATGRDYQLESRMKDVMLVLAL